MIKRFKSFINVTEANHIEENLLEAKKQETSKIHFDKKILIIGYGSVGEAVLPIILKHFDTDTSKITVLEKDNHRKLFRERNSDNDVKYVIKEIVENNLDETLEQYLESGGYLVDVSCNIDCRAIMKWCFEHDVHYINTSLERWGDKVTDEDIKKLSDRTLFHTHKKTRKFAKQYAGKSTATVVSGANPGLVTHLTKKALLLIADKQGKKVETPIDKEGWSQLMKNLGVELIQISERDTQRVDIPKEPNEFCGTWSCIGMMDEGRAPAELGWGTHETPNQDNIFVQGNAAYMDRPGVSVIVKGWVPTLGPYNGFLIQHSEAVTISEYFETKDGKYRPTVYYCYNPCDSTLASLHEFRGRELDPQTKLTIIKEQIIDGKDELGVLLMCKNGKGYWYGSQLSIDEARKLIPGENATSLQVVANMLGSMAWALQNPRMGYVEPENIDFEVVLKHAIPYLGTVPFVVTDWHPIEDTNSLFPKQFDKKRPNSLMNYRVWD